MTYRELYEQEVTTMNYLYTATTIEFKTGANFVDTLIAYDNYGNAYGSLATEWTTSEDGLTWTFKLREGVKWYKNDGKHCYINGLGELDRIFADIVAAIDSKIG